MAPSLPQADTPKEEVVIEIAEDPQVQIVEDVKSPKERIEDVEDKIRQLEQRVIQAQEFAIQRQSPIVFKGYADFGFFAPIGDGTGFVQDFGNQIAPQFAGQFAWVFLGDILAPTINTRGEAADLGNVPGVERFDSVDSEGSMSFIANEVNMTIEVGVSDSARLTTSVNFIPRTGKNFAIGDFLELDMAQLEWVVLESSPTSIFIGKVEPIFGIEYKDRKARTRFGITPSLIARYTTGPSLGLKARSKLFDGWIVLAALVSNGTSMQEQFHFYDEIDSNYGKTLSGRGAVSIPLNRYWPDVFTSALEIGFSGQWGPQDLARDSDDALFFFGPDIEYRGANFTLKGQFMIGEAPGREEDDAFALDLKTGAYIEINYMFNEYIGALARWGIRDALVTLGSERAYLTKSWRATAGLRLSFSRHITLKAEYLLNREFGDVPQIRNDIFTSSLVLAY